MWRCPLLAQSGHLYGFIVGNKTRQFSCALLRPTYRSLASNHLSFAFIGLDRRRERFWFILLAVGKNLRGIRLQTVIIEDAAVCGRIVITAHPVLDELLPFWTKCKPLAAGDVIHVQVDLRRARYRECAPGYGNN